MDPGELRMVREASDVDWVWFEQVDVNVSGQGSKFAFVVGEVVPVRRTEKELVNVVEDKDEVDLLVRQWAAEAALSWHGAPVFILIQPEHEIVILRDGDAVEIQEIMDAILEELKGNVTPTRCDGK